MIHSSRLQKLFDSHPLVLNFWAAAAAFGTYFCMYMFRKPFTAASFSEPIFGDWDQKSVLVTAQVIGYLISKIMGIKIVAEASRSGRVLLLASLIGVSHIALLLFAIVPPPFHLVCIFLNGLPLGLIFGLVLGLLEGRRMTEALTAGLCASFIVAGGVAKSVGRRVMDWSVNQGWSTVEAERWMPFISGLLFVLPIAVCIWMLMQIPVPSSADVAARCERAPMDRQARSIFLQKYAIGMIAISIVFFSTTIMRSFRDDFAPEILQGLGANVSPDFYGKTDLLIAVIVLVVNGMSVLIKNSRKALLVSLSVSAVGFAIVLGTLAYHVQFGGAEFRIGDAGSDFYPAAFMILVGAGLYLPYVAIHTTVFERLIALTRERANVGFLMYVVDSLGYCGYVILILSKDRIVGGPSSGENALSLLLIVCTLASAVSLVLLGFAAFYFSRLRISVSDRYETLRATPQQ